MNSVAMHHAMLHPTHRCSFDPDRQDLYLRLGTVAVFVRDQERSLKFYLDQLGFELVGDTRSPSGDRLLAVAPPDGTAILLSFLRNRALKNRNLLAGPPRSCF